MAFWNKIFGKKEEEQKAKLMQSYKEYEFFE